MRKTGLEQEAVDKPVHSFEWYLKRIGVNEGLLSWSEHLRKDFFDDNLSSSFGNSGEGCLCPDLDCWQLKWKERGTE